MAIELNGTTGITTPDLTSEGGLTVDGVSFASGAPANTLVTTSGGTVLIGESSSDLAATSKAVVIGSAGFGVQYSGTSGTYLKINPGAANGTVDFKFDARSGNYPAATFWTGGSERMSIDSSGNIFMGSFNASGGSVGVKFDIGGGTSETEIQTSVSGTATRAHYRFINNNGAVGAITTNGTSTSYATSSDYRLKENVVGVTGASARVQQLNPVRFNFIADPDTTVDGFLAHEVQDVVPEAITGTKDATEMVDIKDEDGNVTGQEERPVYQGIDQSKLVPLLTAALQEALTKIETLEARVAALEAA